MRWLELNEEDKAKGSQCRLCKANEREGAIAPKVLCEWPDLLRFFWCLGRNLCRIVFGLVFKIYFLVKAVWAMLVELICDIGAHFGRSGECHDPSRRSGV